MNERRNTVGEMMQQPRIVKPGDPAKNFSLKDQNDTTFDLYENMHKRILLSFHPLAWTAFCAGQMKSPEDKRDVFSALNTIAVVPGGKRFFGTGKRPHR
jgi:peroxiredoxin